MIEIYTDGGATPNPGPAKSAIVVVEDDKVVYQKAWKSKGESTNNRAEISAIIMALYYIREHRILQPVTIHTDSRYAEQAINTWLEGWKKKNFRGSNRKPVSNIDLWTRLDAVKEELPHVTVKWIKAHNGNRFNELADSLCRIHSWQKKKK